MITIDDIAKPGSTVLYDGRPTTVLTGHYEDPELGWMIKTSRFPGGMPLDKYILPTQVPGPVETVEVIPAISFELAIIDEVEPVKLTAALIREKSRALTDLTINNMFDEAGYLAVKKAVTKAVKTRTTIEKKEKEILDAMKLRHTSEKKEVTDYTAELYTACREAQTALEAKLTVIDTAKKVAQDKLDAEEKARTEGRDQKMYSIGMTFNGQAFVGYGKSITKENLYSLSDESFAGIVEELEVLQLEQGVTGEVIPAAPTLNVGSPGSRFTTKPSTDFDIGDEPVKLFDNEVYSVSVGGYTWVLTKGSVVSIPGQVIVNQQVMQSAIYSQVISTGFNQ